MAQKGGCGEDARAMVGKLRGQGVVAVRKKKVCGGDGGVLGLVREVAVVSTGFVVFCGRNIVKSAGHLTCEFANAPNLA